MNSDESSTCEALKEDSGPLSKRLAGFEVAVKLVLALGFELARGEVELVAAVAEDDDDE